MKKLILLISMIAICLSCTDTWAKRYDFGNLISYNTGYRAILIFMDRPYDRPEKSGQCLNEHEVCWVIGRGYFATCAVVIRPSDPSTKWYHWILYIQEEVEENKKDKTP